MCGTVYHSAHVCIVDFAVGRKGAGFIVFISQELFLAFC